MGVKPTSVFSHTKQKKAFACLGFFILALIVRTVMMIFTIDVPGDGPTRASGAYAMFLAPRLITYGVWLPGYSYLHSLFYLILENPAVTPRIVNVILGELTVPFFYLLIDRIFDRWSAM